MHEKDILIVEDDKKIITILNNYLKDKCVTYLATSISEARRVLKYHHIDLICQDVVLPDGNGLVFCNEVKKEYKNIKVVILTKRNEVQDRIKSFENGADDYLSKPFYPEELLVRIKRLLAPQEEKQTEQEIIEANGLSLDTQENTLTFNKQKVFLSKSERLIIQLLLLNNGYVSTKELIRYLSTKNSKVLSNNAFTVCVNRLRTKLERVLGRKLITSRYGFGYLLNV